MLDAALAYAARGWAVIPCGNDKKPLVKWKQYQETAPSVEQVRAWWTQWPDANIAMVTGRISGISVLDVDVKNNAGGLDTLFGLLVQSEATLAEVCSQKTWSGGKHYIFAYDPRAREGAASYGKGLDGRNDGGYILVAPSIVNGVPYEWIVEPEALLPMPAWLLAAGTPSKKSGFVEVGGRKNPPGWADKLMMEGVAQGRRDHEAHRLIQHARETGKSEADCWARLTTFGRNCTPSFDPATDDNIAAKIAKAYEREPIYEQRTPLAPVSGGSGINAPKTEQAPSRPMVDWQHGTDLDDTPITYLVEDMIPDGMLGAIGGKDGRGKTLFGLEIARCVLTGNKLFGQFAVKQGKVYAMLLDDAEFVVRARLETMGIADHENLKVVTLKHVDMADPTKLLAYLADSLAGMEPTFILIDALYLFAPTGGLGDQTNSASAMLPVMVALDEIANCTGAVVAVIAHDNKAGGDIAGSRVVRQMLKWIIRVLLPQQFETDPHGGVETNERLLQLNKLKTGRPASWHLKLDGPGRWTFEGTSAEHRIASLEDKIVAHLTETGHQTVVEIRKALGGKEEYIRRAAHALCQRHRLAKGSRERVDGKPGKGAVTYGLPGTNPAGPDMAWVKGD